MKKVIIYSTSACPYCRMAKDFFNEIKIEFINYDVGIDKEKLDEMVKKSSQIGVPVIDIEGEIIIGFDKEKIKTALEV
ncbi:MAG: NrdH-redoxin [Elusimicrobia bacterium]|nr:NrdH-redoxin [Elusimicrobiota bacterium]